MPSSIFRFAVLAAGAAVVGSGGCSDDAPPPTYGAERASLAHYNLGPDRVGMGGYSPVSYFETGRAEMGTTPFVVSHRGVHYKFKTPMQIETFKADPDKYEPACGGWCVLGMASGKKTPADPTSFKIVSGRLLLFARDGRTDALNQWNAGDERALLEAADTYWKDISGEPAPAAK